MGSIVAGEKKHGIVDVAGIGYRPSQPTRKDIPATDGQVAANGACDAVARPAKERKLSVT